MQETQFVLGFVVLTAVKMSILVAVYWIVMPCGQVGFYLHVNTAPDP
jgi:hypothetical protein